MTSPTLDHLLWQLKAVDPIQATLALTEHRFHPVRKWRMDAAWPIRMVAVEVDGGAFIGGRHVTGTGFEADAEKLSTAASMGWRVLRFTPRMIEDGRALTLLLAALEWRAVA